MNGRITNQFKPRDEFYFFLKMSPASLSFPFFATPVLLGDSSIYYHPPLCFRAQWSCLQVPCDRPPSCQFSIPLRSRWTTDSTLLLHQGFITWAWEHTPSGHGAVHICCRVASCDWYWPVNSTRYQLEKLVGFWIRLAHAMLSCVINAPLRRIFP